MSKVITVTLSGEIGSGKTLFLRSCLFPWLKYHHIKSKQIGPHEIQVDSKEFLAAMERQYDIPARE